MTDVGRDVSTYPDLDPTFRWMSGETEAARILAEAVARRLETRAGTLEHDPSYGLDVRDWLNDDIGPRELFLLRVQVKAQLDLDARVLFARVDASHDLATSSLALRVELQVADESDFVLKLAVDRVSARILSIEAA